MKKEECVELLNDAMTSFRNRGEYHTKFDDAFTEAISAIEKIQCLTDRPCSVCKYHSEKGCSQWNCIFDEL